MTEAFLDVLNISFSAVWAVLAVVLARVVLKKAPRRLVCGLWALVALRLIFGGIEAPFSLIPSAELIPPESLFDQAPAIHSGISSIDRAVNPIYSESLRPVPGASVNPLQVWLAVFANLWGLGMIAMGIWAALSWLRVRRQVRESVPDDGVYLCDRVESPFIFGLFRPRIYLPSSLEGDARDHVIAHEMAHLARRDHWWKPLGFVLLTVNWFNPAIWLAYILLCRDIELACDERVIRKLSAVDKKAYSTALLQCSLPRRAIAACPLAFGEVGVKQRVKSVLSYKKPAFWVVALTVVLSLALAACFLTDPTSDTAEIRWNGVLYIQEGDPVDTVPDKQQSTGTLRSVLHDSTPHPTEDGQAVGLGWEYAGQPIVQVGNVLYLQEPGEQGWLKFQMKTPHEFLFDTLGDDPDYLVSVQTVEVWEWDRLDAGRKAELRQILETLRTVNMEHIAGDQRPGGVLSIEFYEDSLNCAFSLNLSAEQVWTLHFSDPYMGIQLWQFRSTALTQWAQPYLDRAGYYAEIFAGKFASIRYQTFGRDELGLTLGIPDGWLAEELTPDRGNDFAAFRFRPDGGTGWIHVYLYPEEAAPQFPSGTPSPAEFPNGLTGMKYSLNADRWEVLQLDTVRGTLVAAMDEDLDWWAELGSVAETILGSIGAFDEQGSVLGTPNRLGITLHAEDVTPDGLTLVCTQDGTPWGEILTGAPWSLEQWTEDGWVSVMPEGTVWTTIAYMVPQNQVTRWSINWRLIRSALEPGRYRVGKAFTGYRQHLAMAGGGMDPGLLGTDPVHQTYWAEFIIE